MHTQDLHGPDTRPTSLGREPQTPLRRFGKV